MTSVTRSQEPLGTWRQIRSICHLWFGRLNRHYGIRWNDKHRFARSIAHYGRALTLNPVLSVAYLERGILYWRELNDPARAVGDFTVALELSPLQPEALFCRGLAYEAMGDFHAAACDLTAYLESGDLAWRKNASSQMALLRAILGDDIGES